MVIFNSYVKLPEGNSSVSGNARKNSGTHHGSAISGRQTAKAFLLDHFWTDIELQTCFWLRKWMWYDVMIGQSSHGLRKKNSGFEKTWRHGWLLYSQKLSTQWSAAMWTKIQLLEILKSQMIKYVAGKIYNIEAPKKSPNMISRYLRAKKDPFIKMKQNLKWC